MKTLLRVLFVFIAVLPAGCSNSSSSGDETAPKIERFVVVCGESEHIGLINEQDKVIRIGAVYEREAITGIRYCLSEGAEISPDPLKVTRWEKGQEFTVIGGDGREAIYTVSLPALREEPEVLPSRLVIGYLPANDWEFDAKFGNLHWEYLTHVNVSFARVKPDGTLNTTKVPADRLRRIVAKAGQHKVKVLISVAKNSIGEFATAIRNEESRKSLVSDIIAFTRNNGLDGFDIDYEEYDDWDTNFPSLLAFVKALHEAKSEDMLMTCAVVSNWLDYTAEWQNYFDYINIMSYDHGVFAGEQAQHASYEAFIKDLNYWVKNNRTPATKIVGGLPFYGYSWDDDVKKDDVRATRFCRILEYFGATGEVADADSRSKTYYNGRKTIEKKCRYVMDNGFAGVMIWQLFQDAHQEELKLIDVVGKSLSSGRADK